MLTQQDFKSNTSLFLTEKEQKRALNDDGDCNKQQNKFVQTTDKTPTWYPRVVASYGRAENAPWSRRLDADLASPDGRPAVVVRRRAAVHDFYSDELADAAFLEREPVSFAVFGKPGVPDDELAAALSAHWGCVHVSVAIGLAAGRASDTVMSALRRGSAVNVVAASAATPLAGLLGLDTAEVRTRGYVLSGFPRDDPDMSAEAQINAVFAVNPPDVLIYVSCPNQDLHTYRNAYVLESMKHARLTNTLFTDDRKSPGKTSAHSIHWYRSAVNGVVAELDTYGYQQNASKAVDEVVKQFDPAFVITVDGRRPVNELLETVKARLATMPVQRPVVPEIVSQTNPPLDGRSSLSEGRSERSYEYDVAARRTGQRTAVEGTGGSGEEELDFEGDGDVVRELRERTRTISEFGRLCPVNFSKGSFVLGSYRYRVKFMGKTYSLAGHEEMRLFIKCPNRFLEFPRPGLPVRAVFYGPESLSGPAARATCKLYGYTLIDVKYIAQIYEDEDKRSFLSTVVGSAINAVKLRILSREGTADDRRGRDERQTLRTAVGDWIRLYFGCSARGLMDVADGEGREENDSETHEADEAAEEDRLLRLRAYFRSYGVDFADDLDACVRAYDEPRVLAEYASRANSRAARADFLRANFRRQPELTDVVVENVRMRNNGNWVVVNAPVDGALANKLIASRHHPIQMVLFSDPSSHASKADGVSGGERSRMFREVFESFKNGTRLGGGTRPDRGAADYDDFVRRLERSERDDADGDEENGDGSFESADEQADERPTRSAWPAEEGSSNARLLERWERLKRIVSENTDRYVDFSVIECKPANGVNHPLQVLIEDTLYHVKKFLSEHVYDVSARDDDTAPERGVHDGDTSVYCPVSFANGRIAIGSKKHMAVYRNRYYYMSSAANLETFIADPYGYAAAASSSLTGGYPKPKITVLSAFGSDPTGLVGDLSDAFGLTAVDWRETFARNVLPDCVPAMVGRMYEEPALRRVVDERFAVSGGGRGDVVAAETRVADLRRYVDRERVRLSGADFAEMNRPFAQTRDGICYTNWPRNSSELRYARENGAGPDAVVRALTDGGRAARERARDEAAANWLAYQYAIVDRAVDRDDAARRRAVAGRRAVFRDGLAAAVHAYKMAEVRARLANVIETIAAETADDGLATVQDVCRRGSSGRRNSEPAALGGREKTSMWSKNKIATPSFRSKISTLTLKQKKIIVEHGLSLYELSALDDFAVLERLDRDAHDRFPEPAYLLPKCFVDGLSASPSDDAVERHLAAENAAFEAMRRYAVSSGVPWIDVPAGDYSRTAVIGEVARATVNGDCAFGTTYEVDENTAERMLRAGEAYLSKFGRWCPVRARDHPGSVQRYHADKRTGRVHPVVHRKYVYFLSGTESRDKFASDPMKYASLEPGDDDPLKNLRAPPADVPLRLAVVGPPRSGKSHVAEKLCARHGFQLIRVEQAVESYLSQYRWTDGASTARQQLRRGGALSDSIVAEAVHAATYGERAVVQGYVLDGFPVTEKQFGHMDGLGVVMHRVFVLDDGRGRGDDDDDTSEAWLRLRRQRWTTEFVGTPWISERYGNVTAMTDYDGIEASVRKCVASLRRYRADMCDDRPCPLDGLPVTDAERRDRVSLFLDLCPVCRVDDGCLNRPADVAAAQRHVVQYRFHFYWVCPRHRDAFARDPRAYADAAPPEPELLPALITEEEASEDPWHSRCANVSAYCAVCAIGGDRLWSPAFRDGKSHLMACYSDRLFAFCTPACRAEFMRRPFLYSRYRMTVAGPGPDAAPPPAVDVRDLPALGFMEQTVGPAAEAATRALSEHRPVYPGHSPAVSAALFFGLYVGSRGGDEDVNEYYQDLYELFVRTCRDFKAAVARLRVTV